MLVLACVKIMVMPSVKFYRKLFGTYKHKNPLVIRVEDLELAKMN